MSSSFTPVARSDEQKRTTEIPLLEGCDIAGKDITGDALLTQRALARYIVKRHAHYHFTVKGNQPTLERDIALLFETRRIGCSTALNATLDFPHVGQVFLIERVLAVNRGHWSIESVHYLIDWHYDEDRSRSVPATTRRTSPSCVASR